MQSPAQPGFTYHGLQSYCLAVFWLALLLASCSWSYGQVPPKAGDKFEHVTVLHDMPADHMGKVMNIMGEALGVGCTHCHSGYDFAQENVAKKAKAREMISMTLTLNQQHFAGRAVVTCMTCHQGQVTPLDASLNATKLATPKLPQPFLPLVPLEPNGQTDASLSVPEILARYHAVIHDPTLAPAAGTKSAGTWSAARIEPSGKQEPETIQWSLPATWEQVTQYGKLSVMERYKAGVVEKLSGDKPIVLKPDEAAMIKIEAHLSLGLKLDELFANWSTLPPVELDRERVLGLRAVDGELIHHFYFDQKSGLLRRRTTTLPTVLGAHVVTVDYRDYQPRNGRRIPLQASFHMPGIQWRRVIDSKQ